MKAQARILAAQQEHPQPRRQRCEKLLQPPQRPGRAKLVQVVDHEPWLFERPEVAEELLDQRLAAEARGRIDPLHDPARIGERGVHGKPEPLRVVLVALDRGPAGAVRQPRGLDPRAHHHRLAAARGRADERHSPGRGRGEAVEQHAATYHPGSPRSRVPIVAAPL